MRTMSTALAIAFALLATGAARAQPSPVTRTLLQKAELDGDRHATTVSRVEVVGGGVVPRHIHPGVEIGYVVQGAGELRVEGKPPLPVKTGDSFQIAEGLPHSLTNGPQPMTLIVVYVTDKGQPLSTPKP